MSDSSTALDIATLGGGCFWCLEAAFQRIPGVIDVKSGYAGGARPNPSYQQVCSGATGHAEVVQIQFNPEEISYPELLDLFWKIHDPTTRNRQGADVGTQYRSVIICHNPGQESQAKESMLRAQAHFPDPIVTEILPDSNFYPAEPEHHNYYNRNPAAGYCQWVILPKLQKAGLDPTSQK